MMELTLDSGLLGEYDYHGDTIELGDIQKPTIMQDFIDLLKILGCGIAGFIMLIIGLTFLGSCMGCGSCISCLDDCSMCDSCQCGTACYECGKECRSGCGCTKDCGSCGNKDDEPSTSSSSSGCGSVKTKQEVYHIVYENGETKDLKYVTRKQGCSVIDEGFDNFGDISRDPEFFTEEGYYKDKKFKKMVISPDGEILKSLKPGATYYSKSKERYVGEERTINIQFMDGSVYPIDVTVGSEISAIAMPPIPTKEGHVFVGGFCGDRKVINSERQLIDPVFHLYNYGSTDQVLNVELKYEVATCQATVYINYSDYTIPFEYGAGLNDVIKEAATHIDSNLNSNQSFVGWSFTNKEDELISPNTMATTKLTKDIELYAIIKTKLSITLDYKNGETDSFDIVPGTLTDLPTTGFTKTGYKFVGWCKNKDLSDTPITEINYEGTNSITLYAKWEPEEYTIQYYSSITNRPLPDSPTTTYTYSEIENITLAPHEDIWTPNGYQFDGWSMKSENVTPYDIIEELPAGTHGNITIYAIYSSKQFTITLDEGYGNPLPSTEKNRKLEYGKGFVLPKATIDDDSKEFIGYFYNDIQVTDKNGNSLISFTEAELNTSYSSLEGITFTAKFDVKKLTVKFYYGTAELIDTQKVTYGEKLVTIPEDQKMNGYQFDGWSKEPGNYVPYDFNDPVISDFSLYTHFTAKTYTIKLAIKDTDIGIATLTTTSFTVTYDESYQIDVPDTNVAYNFKGYKFKNLYVTESNGKSKGIFTLYNLNCTIDELEAGLTFTAEFEMKTFKVYYQVGTSVDSEDVNYGESARNIECKNIPIGYEFEGWIDQATKELYDFKNSEVTSDLHLYAVFKPLQFTFALEINSTYGVLSETSRTVEYDANYTLPVPTLKDGYEFLGYQYQGINITDNKGVSLKPFTVSAFDVQTVEELKSLTLTANCKEIVYNVSYYYNGTLFDQREVKYGDLALGISGPTALEKGYRFVGWTAVQGGTELYDFNTVLTEDLVLYAVVSNQYTVTLYDSDKATVLTTFTVTYGESWSITYNTGLSSSEWLGWYLVDTDKKVVGKNGTPEVDYTTFNFTEDIELYIKK